MAEAGFTGLGGWGRPDFFAPLELFDVLAQARLTAAQVEAELVAAGAVAACAVVRCPAGSSQRWEAPLVSTTSGFFDTSTAVRLRSSP